MQGSMQNHMKITIFGANIKLRDGIVPHFFACQGESPKDRKNRATLQKNRMACDAMQEQDLSSAGMNQGMIMIGIQ